MAFASAQPNVVQFPAVVPFDVARAHALCSQHRSAVAERWSAALTSWEWLPVDVWGVVAQYLCDAIGSPLTQDLCQPLSGKRNLILCVVDEHVIVEALRVVQRCSTLSCGERRAKSYGRVSFERSISHRPAAQCLTFRCGAPLPLDLVLLFVLASLYCTCVCAPVIAGHVYADSGCS
jgi:hypothetical protein